MPATFRPINLQLAVWLLAAAATVQVAAQELDPDKVALHKALFVLNFARFTEWPAARFADDKAPLVITIIGLDSMEPYLEQIAKAENVHDRPMQIRRERYPEAAPGEPVSAEQLEAFAARIRQAHVLCIASSERVHMADILQRVESGNVLTVSDIPRFAELGGMLGLAVREGRMQFDANVQQIERTDLKVSSKLLRLARIVQPAR